MKIELADCTNVLLREIAMKELKQKHIAKTYAYAIVSTYPTDWSKVNNAIRNRWSMSGLQRIKRMAWRLIDDNNR